MTLNLFFDHLYIVFWAVLFSIVAGVPIGVCAYLFRRLRRVILTLSEILQTIPSLALLGIIMVFIGPGKPTVILGLVLYSLLPVVQNTCVGLSEVDPAIKEVAFGMGMTKFYRLLQVELPIASPLIFAGIRIATVTSVGVAVFASSVGGGGLGSIIYQGIRLQNMNLIFSGTLSLMAMAIAFDLLMGFIERRMRGRFAPRNKLA